MSYQNKELLKSLEDSKDYAVELRRHFHKFPELSAEEFKTAEKIEKELDSFAIEHKRLAKTGVYAELKGDLEGERVILLRCDTDALPIREEHICEYSSVNDGVMHACGHDGHTAALLTAAKVLAAHRHEFGGKIIFNFQPGEEIGYGARAMIEEGGLGDAQRCFGIHMASELEVGKVVCKAGANNAAVDQFKITVHGKSAHITRPHQGVDAAYIASQIVVAMQALTTKRVNPLDNALIGVGRMSAGTTYNIVAQTAEIEGTVRTFSPEVRMQIQSELKKLAENTAASYGGSISYFNRDNTSALINDKEVTDDVLKTALALFGESKVITERELSLGGDDMAEYILKIPGMYSYVGSANKDRYETTVAHHNSHFDLDEEAVLIAAKLYACYAYDYLTNNLNR